MEMVDLTTQQEGLYFKWKHGSNAYYGKLHLSTPDKNAAGLMVASNHKDSQNVWAWSIDVPAKHKHDSIHIHWTAVVTILKCHHHFCTTKNGRDHFSWRTGPRLLMLSPIFILMELVIFLWIFKMFNLKPHSLMRLKSSCYSSVHQADCHY